MIVPFLLDIVFKLLKLRKDYDKLIFDLFQKINENKNEIKTIKNINEDLITDNRLINKQYEELNKKFNTLKNKNEDINGDMGDDNQIINIQNENLLNDIQPVRNNCGFFKRNKKKLYFYLVYF